MFDEILQKFDESIDKAEYLFYKYIMFDQKLYFFIKLIINFF